MSTTIDDRKGLSRNVKGLMQDKLFELDTRVDAARARSRYAELRPSEVRVLRALRGRPMSVAELGRRLSVSRQAAHKPVAALVERGLVRLEHHPDNARDKHVIMTEAGQRLRRTVAQTLQKIEAEISESIGPENLEILRDLLSRDWFRGQE